MLTGPRELPLTATQPFADWHYVQEAAAYLRPRMTVPLTAGIVLGSGLGGLAEEIEEHASWQYAEIPHFPQSTAIGHANRLRVGMLSGHPVCAMQGRVHLYEGYSPRQVTFGVRVMQTLGIRVLVVSNAAGGLKSNFHRSEVMAIEDHINLMFANPLMGSNEERWGPRFSDMSQPYDQTLIEKAEQIARRHAIVLHRGVYVGLRGPTYETRAEYRMLRRLGADAVGMSTVPEVLVARHAGMRVFGISVITNVASPDALPETSHAEVVDAAHAASPALRILVRELIASLPTISPPSYP